MNEQLIEKVVTAIMDLDINLHDAPYPQEEARDIAVGVLTALGADEERHMLRVRFNGNFALQHPVHERLLGSLMECEVHEGLEYVGTPRAGWYWVDVTYSPGATITLTKKED
jgi:hypothetical protein